MTPSQVRLTPTASGVLVQQRGRLGGSVLAAIVFGLLSLLTAAFGGSHFVGVMLAGLMLAAALLGRRRVEEHALLRDPKGWRLSEVDDCLLDGFSLHWEGTLSPRLVLSVCFQGGRSMPCRPLIRSRRPEPLLRWTELLGELTGLPIRFGEAELAPASDQDGPQDPSARASWPKRIRVARSEASRRSANAVLLVNGVTIVALLGLARVELERVGHTPSLSWILMLSVPVTALVVFGLVRFEPVELLSDEDLVIRTRGLADRLLGKPASELRVAAGSLGQVVCIGHQRRSSSALLLRATSMATPSVLPAIITLDRDRAPQALALIRHWQQNSNLGRSSSALPCR